MTGSDQNIRRVHYFAGQLLTAEDFQAEQEYFRERLHRHNRLLHGYGVVFGLQVALAGQGQVVIHPGAALDCQGNELVVMEPVMGYLPEQGKRVYVALSYCEWFDDPVPGREPAAEDEATAYTRVVEGFQVDLHPKDPARPHQPEQALAGCDQPDALVLARLVRKAGGWELDRKFKPPQAKPPRSKAKPAGGRKKPA